MLKISSWIKTLLREYYRKAPLKLPRDYILREFAFQHLDKDIYIRHLSFYSLDELRKYIDQNIPRHAYFSSAKYANPASKDMKEKDWLGSDLVFDIDADHIPSCSIIEYRFCPKCGYVVQSTDNQSECPYCKSKLKDLDIITKECIDVAKEQCLNLIEVIESDLGLREYEIAFSGNRGFHVLVYLPDKYARISSEARREIVEYLKAELVNIDSLSVKEVRKRYKRVVTVPPRVVDGGIRRRFAKAVLNEVNDVEIRQFILGKTDQISLPKLRTEMHTINKALQDTLDRVKIYIDEKVTIDTSRLIRIANSVNGKSGLIAKALDKQKLYEFEINEDLSPFSEYDFIVRFLVSIPRIPLLGEEIKFKRGDVVKIDGFRATILAFKDIVEVLNVKR